jgi:hypothetical protein
MMNTQSVTTTTATREALTSDALYMTVNGVASGNRSIVAEMRDSQCLYALELKIVAGKDRAKALFAWLKERAPGRSFDDLRADAFAWCAANPRGKRSGFVAPA